MAQYTQSIREILQQNKTSAEDLRNIDDVKNIANRTLFNFAPLNLLKEDYRDQFVTGFTLHYFNDEIGLETLPLWQIAFNEKLVTSAEYINQVYDLLDKQIFSDYIVKESETHQTGSELVEVANDTTKTGEQTINDTTSSEEESGVSNHATNAGTGSLTNTNVGVDVNTDSGTVDKTNVGEDKLEKTGDDTTVRVGEDVNVKSGDDTTLKVGQDVDVKSGDDTTTKVGVDNDVKVGASNKLNVSAGEDGKAGSVTHGEYGSNTTVNSSQNTTENVGITNNDQNAVAVSFDTPQGSVGNMRTRAITKGEGVNAAFTTPGSNAGAYNYMTGATESDASTVQTEGSRSTVDNQGGETIMFGHKTIDTYGIDGDVSDPYKDTHKSGSSEQVENGESNNKQYGEQNKVEYGSTDTKSYGSSDKIEYNSTDTKTFGSSDKVEYNSVDTKTFGNSETESRDLTNNRQYGSQDVQDRDTLDTQDSLQVGSKVASNIKDATINTSDSTTGTVNTDKSNEVDGQANAHETHLNWEMLYRSMPLLNKVWELFSDLFMILL